MKIFSFFLFILLYVINITAKVDISGYLENRFFIINSTEINWSDLENKVKFADYNRLRLKLQASPSESVSVNIAVDFFSFYGAISSPFGTSSNETEVDTGDVLIKLDRVYADIHFKNFDLSIGKQRVAMGVSYIWSPLDIFITELMVNIFPSFDHLASDTVVPKLLSFLLFLPSSV